MAKIVVKRAKATKPSRTENAVKSRQNRRAATTPRGGSAGREAVEGGKKTSKSKTKELRKSAAAEEAKPTAPRKTGGP